MTKHPIPEGALAHHLAILGKAGSGKTYTAKGLVEHILSRKGRVCVIDPTGAWHGLRSSASGKRAGFPIVIFGGEHSDLPLGQEHGEAMAEIIGTSTTPTILDTSMMRVGERTRFFADFAEGLLRKNKGPLHLIIDEAHLFAPQGKVNDPQSGKMVNAANNLVSLGRLRGLRVTLITQRPAKLHKDSLTQVETLIAMRLIAPQDRKAVEEWIKDNADEAKAKEIMSSLAKLPTGTGWIWAPELDILKRATFPKIKTLDTSKAPVHLKKGKGPVLAPINRKAIEQKLRDAAIEVVANDPRNLKAEIADLKKQLAGRTAKAQPVVDRAAIKTAEAVAYAKGVADGYEKAVKISSGNTKGLLAALNKAQSAVRLIEQWAEKRPPEDVRKPKVPRDLGTPPVPGSALVTAIRRVIGKPAPAPKGPQKPVKTNGKAPSTGDLGAPQRRVMASLGFWVSTGQGQPTRAQVAAVAGYKPGSGGFNNIIGSLTTQGLVAVSAPGRLSSQDGSFGGLSPSEAREMLLGVFNGPQRKLVDAALAAGGDMTRSDLAEAAGYKPGSGGFNNITGTLTTMDVLQKPSAGRLEISDWAREVLS